MTRIYRGFDARVEKCVGINDMDEIVKIEYMSGCDGNRHADQYYRVYYRYGEVVFAEELGMKERGACNGACRTQYQDQHPDAGFLHGLMLVLAMD